MVALSTTLATNALVEGTGRPACLVTIGFEAGALDRGGLRDAIGSDAVIVVGGGHTSHGEEVEPLDLDELAERIDEIADTVDGFAVTAQFSTRNAEHELAAAELIRARTGKPVTCSHVLSAALGCPRRGVTALLNARLIAMIDELVTTTATTLADRGVDAPMMIVRGNGSLVSVDFVAQRPVETILSGPAASLVGAAHLAAADDAVIADIGGTTTDIAVVRTNSSSAPRAPSSVAIAPWSRLFSCTPTGWAATARCASPTGPKVPNSRSTPPGRALSLMAEEHGDVIRRELEAGA